MQDIFNYTEAELTNLGEAIVWMAVLAAVHNDGVVHEDEKAEAIKQTHIRTFHGSDYMRPIYQHLDHNFEENFDRFSAEANASGENKEEYIADKLKEKLEVLQSLGPIFAERFNKDMKDYFNRIFKVGSNAFQFFAFPVISAHLDKFGIKH